MVRPDIKDLFKATQVVRIFINRCGDRLLDRDKMLDYRQEGLIMIRNFEEESECGLSNDMKRFLRHRICQAASSQNNC